MTFASSFFVAPNTIDFDTVFSKFDITNAAVYGTLIGLGVVWVLGLVWVRRKDKKDKERWLVGYLRDNLVDDSYFYLVTVHTGIRRGAGTLSNVKFILTGQGGDTGVRVLSDGKRTLDTGSVMSYILATTQALGDLCHVRIWHDDSGPNGRSDWYLSRITAEDLQTGERFNFICEKWLALDKEDGLIDRIVPVTLKDEVMTFDKLFAEHARVGVTDTHLWISCFLRPDRSTFSRVQRLTCCMCLLLLTMITSAMFYQPEDIETGESTNKIGMEVTVGIMRFSMATLWTSTVSIIITTIPTLLFVLLFRSCRPHWGARAKAQEHRRLGLLQMTKSSKLLIEKEEKKKNNKKKKKKKKGKDDDDDDDEDQNVSDLLDDVLQQNPLPHFVMYLTWLLLLGTMAACAFFLLLYSMQWGKTTSEEWLASFFLSFFESIFVLDPVKVLVIACLLAYCASNPYFNTHYQHVDLQRVSTEAENFGSDQIDPTAVPPDPIPDTVLEAARKRRAQEQLAQQVFFELVLYIFYVFCVFNVSYGHRDQNTYLINNHLNTLFYAVDGDAPVPFESISSREDVMAFINQTIRDTAFPWSDLTGEQLPWRLRNFASDFTSFRLGPVRVRQVRMPRRTGTYKVTRMYPALSVNNLTFAPYDVQHEETRAYCVGWEPRECTDDETLKFLTIPSWSYRASNPPAPVWGIFAFYPSGGYFVDFVINRDVVNNMIRELHENVWLDLQTKAVFVEMSLYNPNINLFSYLRMAVEFPEVGSNVVWKDFKTLKIYGYLGAMGAYIFICEMIFLFVLLILTVKAVLKLKKQRLGYFKDVWQVLDACSLLISYTGIVFYAIKSVKIDEIMRLWRYDPKTTSQVYVDFYLPILYDDIYGYILASLVFVVSLRLLRILGYNKRITMIATVLGRSGEDLFGFFIVFFIVVTAYMAAGVVLFASTIYQFRSIWDSYCTLYLVLLGKNVLGRFIGAAPLWAQVYYCSLTILVIFILYTMFQAILCNSTSVVRANIATVPPPYGLVNVLEKFYRTAVADWVPAWFVKAPQAVGPADKVRAVGMKSEYMAYPKMPAHYAAQDNRTQPHRVLATLAEHFNRYYQGEEKKARRKKKAAFTSLNKQKGTGTGNDKDTEM
ncbi:polycystin-1-like protein 2 [Babylonia areolata]|uniref:polycystin-1-like protein 2 n=1 Tax=Babylonia areolata TaxID=304850 RepID=UPI003FD052AA